MSYSLQSNRSSVDARLLILTVKPQSSTLCSIKDFRCVSLNRSRLLIGVLAISLEVFACGRVSGATKYFDSTSGAGNGVGGTATLAAQTTAVFSNVTTGDATLSAALATDDGVFQGTAGVVTLGAAFALNSATFNITNYTLTTSTTTARTFSAPITLASNVNLNLIDAGQTGDRTLGVASVTGGAGSGLTIQGAETGSSSARINLAVANSTINVPTTINGTGTSLAGFVATASGENITNTIANNSNFTTLIGATSGSDLTLSSAAIISGSAGVQFSGGAAGGAGLVTVNSVNTYTGATTINNSTTGVIRIGVDNALPSTALQFGILSNSTGALDLNGHSQTVASLAVTGTGTVNGIANTSSTSAALIVNGSASTTYSSTIGIPANLTSLAGANNNISLTLAATNTGILTLTGANTYVGNTAISGGTLKLTSATNNIAGSKQITVGSGANSKAVLDVTTFNGTGSTLGFNLANGQTLAGTGTVKGAVGVSSGSTITAGTGATSNDKPGQLTISGTTTINSGGIYSVKIDGAQSTVTNGQNGDSAVAGVGNDVLQLSGFSSAGTGTVVPVIVNNSNFIPFATYSYLIATDKAANMSADEFAQLIANVAAQNAGYTLSDDFTPTSSTEDLYLNETTPEPTSVLLVGGAVFPLALSRRRRKVAISIQTDEY